ncbi:MoaD/ThiS family protein [Natronobiforma cellulositropha]|uniref:MoaD/ThiS family protein n=1 Tax=Natronobiforma cellulositropha TaxID=1679076 RepID=UPI0021D600B8|nr:MoaD/ThiS family protein [Natronobiforma cellulositropha]
MELTVYGPVRDATGEKVVEVAFEGGSVEDALETFVETYPDAESQVFDGDDLAANVRVTLEGERVGLDDACPADGSLTIFPAIHGG